jgi:hypothetical protein
MAYSVWAAIQRRVIPDFGTIPIFARDYLRVLCAEYAGIPKADGFKELAQVEAVITKVENDQSDRNWTWADLVTVENATLNVTPASDLRATAMRWRERYRDIVGDTRYTYYAQSAPDAKTASADDLRADIRSLADRTHYLLATVTAREKMRNRLTLFLGVVMVVAALVVLAPALSWQNVLLPAVNSACAYDTYCIRFSAFELVALAGLFGGFVSVQQRLQSANDIDPFFKRLELSAGWGSIILIAPLMGMVFAIVLFELFVSGMVSGQLFPGFVSIDGAKVDLSSFQSFSVGSTPKSPTDWAKLAVWGFIAGFAERLVPDVVSRLADMKNIFSEAKS